MKGAYEIELALHSDERGSFGRSFCRQEFEAHGLNPLVAQCNDLRRGQADPLFARSPLRRHRGPATRVADVSSWFGVELKSEPGRPARMLYVPEGFAHGFLTLKDDTEVFCQMSEFYAPSAARGFRWNDPVFAIEWPEPVRVFPTAIAAIQILR